MKKKKYFKSLLRLPRKPPHGVGKQRAIRSAPSAQSAHKHTQVTEKQTQTSFARPARDARRWRNQDEHEQRRTGVAEFGQRFGKALAERRRLISCEQRKVVRFEVRARVASVLELELDSDITQHLSFFFFFFFFFFFSRSNNPEKAFASVHFSRQL